MIKKPLYLLKFKPILKEKVWGGNKLVDLFNKEGSGKLGESWEISGVKEGVSVVSNGTLTGQSLTKVIKTYKDELLGGKVYATFGETFPLLFKFIDAHEDLSVQLHPGDDLAKERHDSFGKTEMWYILQAEENANLIVGFKFNTTVKEYQEKLLKNRITDILTYESVRKGDSFYIAPGTVHAIGAGVFLAEIQQTSDVTYRIYDWDRPGLDGKMRELHTDEAKKAINFEENNARIHYESIENTSVLLKSSPYFETNKLVLTQSCSRNLMHKDSFVVYMCVSGKATVSCQNNKESLQVGETILIPQQLADIHIETKEATLLEVYIP